MEGDEVEACAMQVCADADVDVTWGNDDGRSGTANVFGKNKKGAKDKDASAKCDDGSNSDADANDHDADAATDGEATGDDSGKDSDDDVSVSVACSIGTGRSWGRERGPRCGQGQGSSRPHGSCVAVTNPSPSPIQKQSASRLSSTAPMNQGPSPGSPVVKDKLASYITQMTVGTQTGRRASLGPDGRPLPP